MLSNTEKRLLSRKEAAKYLGLSKSTLKFWASKARNDLPFVRIGRLAKYRLEDLDAFITRHTVGGEAA